jgi:hypothetical protein
MAVFGRQTEEMVVKVADLGRYKFAIDVHRCPPDP